MTTPAELKAAEQELADIAQRERLYFGFLLSLERQYPGSDDVVRKFFHVVGIKDEVELDRKIQAFRILAMAPRLVA